MILLAVTYNSQLHACCGKPKYNNDHLGCVCVLNQTRDTAISSICCYTEEQYNYDIFICILLVTSLRWLIAGENVATICYRISYCPYRTQPAFHFYTRFM
jgi:hypothetical protein